MTEYSLGLYIYGGLVEVAKAIKEHTEVVRQRQAVEDDIKTLSGLVESLSARVVAQSELLSKHSERKEATND